jgi:hypothetical protein
VLKLSRGEYGRATERIPSMPGEPRRMFGIKLAMPRWVASCPACRGDYPTGNNY